LWFLLEHSVQAVVSVASHYSFVSDGIGTEDARAQFASLSSEIVSENIENYTSLSTLLNTPAVAY
jgi:hypothetical protein